MTKKLYTTSEVLDGVFFKLLQEADQRLRMPDYAITTLFEHVGQEVVRKGRVRYGQDIAMFNLNGLYWTICKGKKFGLMESDFEKELVVFDVSPLDGSQPDNNKLVARTMELAQGNNYFSHSLILVKNDGEFDYALNPNSRKLERRVQQMLLKYRAAEIVTSNGQYEEAIVPLSGTGAEKKWQLGLIFRMTELIGNILRGEN